MKAVKPLPVDNIDLVLSGGASNGVGIVACAYAILSRLPPKARGLPRRVAGTSVGSLGAILIARGVPVEVAKALFRKYLRNDALLDGNPLNLVTKMGWCSGDRIWNAIHEVVGDATFGQTLIPLHVYVGDVYFGRPQLLSSGMTPHVRLDDGGTASSSVPFMFGFREIRGPNFGNRRFTDGGTAKNFAMDAFDDDDKCPTVGVRVRSSTDAIPVRGFDLTAAIKGLARLLLWSSDNAHMSTKNWTRVVDFVGGDGLDFSLTDAEFDRRWAEGWAAGLAMELPAAST